MSVTYDFGRKGIVWEGHSCAPRGFEGTGFGVSFYGEKGTMVLAGSDCKIYDSSNKLVREIGNVADYQPISADKFGHRM